ncbi:MAG: PAS domain S-box protein [Proteobacteria bacterium]|nr:PAS domain S-box protein [Pseudomonadota bacterium]
MGHYFKIVAFYLVYRAIIQTGLEEPYGLMFRELQQSQVALQESEEKYRAVVENADEAIMVVQDGKIRFVNSRTQKD